ncbi:hypothetical protein NA57DRAFT_71835 [Rhizodiscina lignyota]|uniref:RNA polymerase I-specific transcription initiation factor RRN6-like protein n=1 Tax=Rhizodiscina lignyota TaxID=1504668 RepID=A0A9P4MA45_9PEZI|nr:hypothetical protein NA57DRAFT_71835 [Rhizodiscina lignyota]
MTSQLSYGHFGRAEYDRNTNSWRFQRQYDTQESLISVAELEDALPSTSTTQGDATPNLSVGGTINRNPELQPALRVLKEYATDSRSSLPDTASPGSLISFGQLAYANEPQRARLGATIVAFAAPGGENGDALRITRVQNSQRRLDEEGSHVEVPVFSDEVGWWVGLGEPIRQIRFAQVLKSQGSLLAVRLSTQIIIFRPLWHSTKVPPSGTFHGCPYPPSRIDANPILTIPIRDTGGCSHVDICFNPGDQRQLAVVDEKGNWAVLNISGRHSQSRLSYAAKTIKKGTVLGAVPVEDVDEEFDESLIDDAPIGSIWHRVLWVQSLLIIASRYKLEAVHHQRGSVLDRLLPLGSNTRQTPLLDIQMNPLKPDEVFILDTKQLLLLRVGSATAPVKATLIFSWTHFRDSEDYSLRLSVSALGQDAIITLYSRSFETLTAIRYSQANDTSGTFVQDPVILRNVHTDVSVKDCCGLVLLALQVGRAGDNAHPEYLQDSYRAIYLQLQLLPDCKISAKLIGSFNSDDTLREARGFLALRAKRPRRLYQSDAFVLRDDFVVRAGLEGADAIRTARVFDRALIKATRYETKRTSRRSGEQLDMWTIDNTPVYVGVTGAPSEILVPFEEIIEGLRDLSLHSDQEQEHPTGSLFELDRRPTVITDIEQSAQDLQDLVMTWDPALLTSLPAQLLSIELSPNIPEVESSGPIWKAYDDIITSWVSQLPHETPTQTRKHLSDLASSIAAECCLASVVIRRPKALHRPQGVEDEEGIPTSLKGKERQRDRSYSASAPASPGYELSQSQDSSIVPFDSQLEPRSLPPTPSATPSIVSGSSFSSTAPNEGDLAFERLSRLTSFGFQPTPLPQRWNGVPAHWTPGSDPNEYSWARARREVEKKSESRLTKKAERKARQKLRRERIENASALAGSSRTSITARQLEALASRRGSPIPSGSGQLAASQPVYAQGLGESQSQSQPSQSRVMGIPGMASQIESGAFGGRPPPRKRPRRAGF